MTIAAMSLLGPSVAMAGRTGSDAESTPRVTLAFDTTIVGHELGARLEQALIDRIGPVLEREELRIVGAAEISDRTMRVRIIAFDEEHRDYEVELQMTGEAAKTSLPAIRCEACNERRLVEMVVEHTPRLVELHEESLQGVQSADARNVEVDTPSWTPTEGRPAAEDARSVEGERKPLGPLGATGIGIAAVGVATTIAGGVSWSRGRVFVRDENNPQSEIRNYTPQGKTLAGLGIGAVVVGVAMLSVDLTVLAKRRNPAAQARISPVIQLDRVGLVVEGRF